VFIVIIITFAAA